MIAPPITTLPLPVPRPYIPVPGPKLPYDQGITQPPITTLPLPEASKQLQGNGQGPDAFSWGKLDVTYTGNRVSHRTYDLVAPLSPAMPLNAASYEDAVQGVRHLLLAADHNFNAFALTNHDNAWFASGLRLDDAVEYAFETPTGTGGIDSWRLHDGPRGAVALITDAQVARYEPAPALPGV
ncbi:MAG: hypothetical protein JWM90_1214 [Thermoleophilia bacterium]|nr:hypothetical protein [Thermoleophilia bacterium]